MAKKPKRRVRLRHKGDDTVQSIAPDEKPKVVGTDPGRPVSVRRASTVGPLTTPAFSIPTPTTTRDDIHGARGATPVSSNFWNIPHLYSILNVEEVRFEVTLTASRLPTGLLEGVVVQPDMRSLMERYEGPNYQGGSRIFRYAEWAWDLRDIDVDYNPLELVRGRINAVLCQVPDFLPNWALHGR